MEVIRSSIFLGLELSLCAELNIFENFFSNSIFLGVLAFTAFLQVLMVEVFGDFASTTGLAWDMWLFSIGVGALSIPFGKNLGKPSL